MPWLSFVRFLAVQRPLVGKPVLGLVALGLSSSVAGCSGDPLSSELLETTTAVVQDRLEQVDVRIGESVAQCAARKLTDDQAAELSAEILRPDVARTLTDNVVACAGVVTIARSSLTPLAPTASEASLDCAAKRLDSELVRKVLAADLQGERLEGALVDLDVATALGACLTPAELLDVANG